MDGYQQESVLCNASSWNVKYFAVQSTLASNINSDTYAKRYKISVLMSLNLFYLFSIFLLCPPPIAMKTILCVFRKDEKKALTWKILPRRACKHLLNSLNKIYQQLTEGESSSMLCHFPK